MNDFFKVTVDFRLGEDWTMLYGWLKHFDKISIPAGLVVDQDAAAIWRPGRRLTSIPGGEVDKITGTLQAHVNGFSQLWKAAGGKIAIDPAKRRYRHEGA